jgi:uncharacterized membrane protein YccC
MFMRLAGLLRRGADRIRPHVSVHTLAPEDVWPEAARMTVAAVAAFAVCRALHMHGGFFAVLTALMTTRPSAGGGKAILDRLIGMGAGVAVGLSVVWLQRFHVPPEALVALAMVPLCYMVARFRKYQAAPITAIIVLSAGNAVGMALHSALMRVAEVCIGAGIGFLVSLLVFRRTSDRRSRQHAADVLRGFGALMAGAVTGGPARRDMALRNRLRSDLRMVSVTSRILPGQGRRLGKSHIMSLSRMQQDLLFLARALSEVKLPWRARARSVLERLAHAFESLCGHAAETVLEGGPTPDFGAFDAALRALRALPLQRGMPRGDEANEALPFLLLRLRADLHEVLEGYAGAPEGDAIDAEAESFDDALPGMTLLPS